MFLNEFAAGNAPHDMTGSPEFASLLSSATDLGINSALQFLPTLFLGAWAGSLSDRFDRQRLTAITQSLMAVQALALGFLDLAGVVNVPIVYALTFSLGLIGAIDNPVRTSNDVDSLSISNTDDLGYVGESIQRVVAALGGRVPVIGFVGAPFTMASYMIEGGPSKNFLKTKQMMYHDETLWRRLMGKLVDVLGTFAVMALAGFSLNNLTLMALTIATGFVVDDAVVVMEGSRIKAVGAKGSVTMPPQARVISAAGKTILQAMTKEYGPEKGQRVFYASRNAGKIKGVDRARGTGRRRTIAQGG